MSFSPELIPPAPSAPSMPSSTMLMHHPPSSVADLLAESYREVEASGIIAAETPLATSNPAFRPDATSQPSSPSNNNSAPTATPLSPADEAAAIILAHEESATRAEAQRDEAEARRALIADNWAQLNQYLASIDAASTDARLGFARIVLEGGGPLVLSPIPVLGYGLGLGGASGRLSRTDRGVFATASTHQQFPSLPLPPYPDAGVPSGMRRARTPSIDSYASLPQAKKARREYDKTSMYMSDREHTRNESRHPPIPPRHQQQYRQQLPPGEHQPRTHHSSKPLSSHSHLHPQQQPPSRPHHPESKSRSHSHSPSDAASAGSLDDMIIQASSDGSGASGAPPSPIHFNGNGNNVAEIQLDCRSRQRERDREGRPRSSHAHHQQQQVQYHPQDDCQQVKQQQQQQQYHQHQVRPDYPMHEYARGPPLTKAGGSSVVLGGTGGAEPHAQPGQAREFQTHIFAPPVTGAPQKKPKYGSGVGAASSLPQAPPVAAFPPTNEQGQRICRQCGMAGRYKDGKCVEKWGPGPMGPGTVCDPRRKKMKRVERRGTLETQQLQQQQLAANASTTHVPPHRNSQSQSQSQPIHRTDTMPAHASQSQHARVEDTSQYTSPRPPPTTSNAQVGNTASPRPTGTRPPPSPPPIAAIGIGMHEAEIPTSAIGRGTGRGTPVGTKKASPLGAGGGKPGRSPAGAMDVDADGEAEVDAEAEAEIEGLVTGEGGRGRSGDDAEGEGEGEEMDVDADAEADLGL
ncbi:hypothetical protein Hypma_016162 [Hypsizygus marmoreus]|uniref:Uncharacterized protein n=1 Tax=Hypsizygus marmoreus TaxID=39966 RepID=A0A369J809_HYPMA|nr:hypothetical protein Hypma_016162 [Hypsizygus marmoreus]